VATTAKDFDEEDLRPIKLLFQDEGRFGRISDPAHCWAPKGIRPTVPTHIVREYTHVFSAVCPHDGPVMFSYSPLCRYCCNENVPSGIVLNILRLPGRYGNGPRLHGNRTSDIETFENIRIIYQPSYSPELNPVEHLWEYIRETI